MIRVTFTRTYEYEIDTTDEELAYKRAYEMFVNDNSRPVANTSYDDCEIEDMEDNEL